MVEKTAKVRVPKARKGLGSVLLIPDLSDSAKTAIKRAADEAGLSRTVYVRHVLEHVVATDRLPRFGIIPTER